MRLPGELTLTAAAPVTAEPATCRDSQRLIAAIKQQILQPEMRDRAIVRACDTAKQPLADCVIAFGNEPHLPEEVFDHLRWGGLFVYVHTSCTQVRATAAQFNDDAGFHLQQQPTYIWHAPLGVRLNIPGIATRGHYFIARKTHLLQQGDLSDRFTYDVQLTPCDTAEHGYVVTKQVPSYENIRWRLGHKFPDVDPADLDKRAHKLVDHVFPTFLTRETAILQILQQQLPEAYRSRVPQALAVQKDENGFVRQLQMNWLRVGGKPLTQLEFARQSADLLAVLHERARVMHLDLRLDNIVITEQGVCFVDFGSAVRIGEDIQRSPVLTTLFSEMMRTSQIQRMLGRMLEKGHVTSQVMRDVHGKVDKTVDSFYLAVQINRPHGNPEIKHLIQHDPNSPQAKSLEALTAAILRPKTPGKEEFKTAHDILRGIRRIYQRQHAQAARENVLVG